MFRLERVSIHDWYFFEGCDIEVSGSIALIGQTGAGKSAIVDAIQTVRSGNNRNVIKLTSVAGEARDCRVMDYCLGCVTDVDEGRPMRRSSETMLALTFSRADTSARGVRRPVVDPYGRARRRAHGSKVRRQGP